MAWFVSHIRGSQWYSMEVKARIRICRTANDPASKRERERGGVKKEVASVAQVQIRVGGDENWGNSQKLTVHV